MQRTWSTINWNRTQNQGTIQMYIVWILIYFRRETWRFAVLRCWRFFNAVMRWIKSQLSVLWWSQTLWCAMFVFFTLWCLVKWNCLRCWVFYLPLSNLNLALTSILVTNMYQWDCVKWHTGNQGLTKNLNCSVPFGQVALSCKFTFLLLSWQKTYLSPYSSDKWERKVTHLGWKYTCSGGLDDPFFKSLWFFSMMIC